MPSLQDTISVETYWNLEKENALRKLSATEAGLSNDEAAARFKNFGPNTIKASSRTSSFVLFYCNLKALSLSF